MVSGSGQVSMTISNGMRSPHTEFQVQTRTMMTSSGTDSHNTPVNALTLALLKSKFNGLPVQRQAVFPLGTCTRASDYPGLVYPFSSVQRCEESAIAPISR